MEAHEYTPEQAGTIRIYGAVLRELSSKNKVAQDHFFSPDGASKGGTGRSPASSSAFVKTLVCRITWEACKVGFRSLSKPEQQLVAGVCSNGQPVEALASIDGYGTDLQEALALKGVGYLDSAPAPVFHVSCFWSRMPVPLLMAPDAQAILAVIRLYILKKNPWIHEDLPAVFSAPALDLGADRKRAGALVGHPPQDDRTMDAVVFIGKALTDRLDGEIRVLGTSITKGVVDELYSAGLIAKGPSGVSFKRQLLTPNFARLLVENGKSFNEWLAHRQATAGTPSKAWSNVEVSPLERFLGGTLKQRTTVADFKLRLSFARKLLPIDERVSGSQLGVAFREAYATVILQKYLKAVPSEAEYAIALSRHIKDQGDQLALQRWCGYRSEPFREWYEDGADPWLGILNHILGRRATNVVGESIAWPVDIVPDSSPRWIRLRANLPPPQRDLVLGFFGTAIAHLVESASKHVPLRFHPHEEDILPQLVAGPAGSDDLLDILQRAPLQTCIAWADKLRSLTNHRDVGVRIWSDPNETLAELWHALHAKHHSESSPNEQLQWTTVHRTLQAAFRNRHFAPARDPSHGTSLALDANLVSAAKAFGEPVYHRCADNSHCAIERILLAIITHRQLVNPFKYPNFRLDDVQTTFDPAQLAKLQDFQGHQQSALAGVGHFVWAIGLELIHNRFTLEEFRLFLGKANNFGLVTRLPAGFELDRSNLLPPWLHFVLEKHQIYLDWLQRRRILRLAHSSAAALNQTTTTALQQQVPKKGLLAGALSERQRCTEQRCTEQRAEAFENALACAMGDVKADDAPAKIKTAWATRIIAEYLDDMLDCQDILPSPELLCANQWADVDKFVDRMGDLQVLKHSSGVAAETPTTTWVNGLQNAMKHVKESRMLSPPEFRGRPTDILQRDR